MQPPPPSSREMIQGLNSLLGSSQISLHDLHAAAGDDFFDQVMLSSSLPPWPDLAPANADDHHPIDLTTEAEAVALAAAAAPHKHGTPGLGFPRFDEPAAAILASRLRHQQIGNGGSKAAMMMHQQHQMLLAPHDVVDGSGQGGGGHGGGSVQSLYNGFAGPLHASSGQAPNPAQLFHPPQGGATQAPPNFTAQAAAGAAASASMGGGAAPAQPKQQRVRARRGQATDPHSIAERLRRERIAERMRSLQELVPNGNKTDKASMLDEIIEYVKFLQLQVKVLSMSRLGGAAAMAPLMAAMSSGGGGDSIQAGANGGALGRNGSSGGNQGAPAGESVTAAEHQVARLMEEDMGSAMQYLQGKGLCLMPISLATTISTANTSHRTRNHPVAAGANSRAQNTALRPGGEGPTSPSASVLTVQSAATLGNGPGLDGGSSGKDNASVSKP
ncbi:hypothetical protein ACJRO7_013445 [Eucalyptus globulus]|uniref:BHLH domain-containing protein n=1 Tax=Eucalyptus globulus TaxID=34317 RepID=A0ABD3L2U4_EUCGL